MKPKRFELDRPLLTKLCRLSEPETLLRRNANPEKAAPSQRGRGLDFIDVDGLSTCGSESDYT
jgi:hypothetical protein